MTSRDKAVSKDTLFNVIATEATGFYNLLITVASSFLGGSLLFMEKIAPRPSLVSLWVLALGWLLLMACVGIVAWVRLANLDSGEKALRREYDDAQKLDARKVLMCKWSLRCLVLGMATIMIFGFMNISADAGRRRVAQMSKLTNDRKIVKPERIQSIPFGSAGGGNNTKPSSGDSGSGNSGSNSGSQSGGQSGQKPKK